MKVKQRRKLFNLDLNWLGVFICILGTLFYYYEYYLRVAPAAMRNEVKLAYGLNEAGFGFLVGLYYWAYVPLQLVVGIFMDLLGPRKALTIACLISALGTYLFGFSNYLMIAQLGRFLVGFGAAFAYVGVLKLSNIWLPHKLFAFMAGLCSTLGMLGGITGQIIITHGVAWYGWRVVTIVSGLIGLFFSLILWLIVKDHQDNINKHSKKLDFENLKFSNQLSILKTDLKQVIKLPDLWLNGIIGCLIFAGLSVFADLWAISFLNLLGLNKANLGFSSSMIYIGFGVGAPIWGIVSDLLNNRKILLIMGSFISAILLVIIIYFKLSLLSLNILLFLFGFFLGVEILVFALVNDLCPKEITATAVGFVNMLIMLSGSYLQPKIGFVIDYLGNSFSELNKFRIALSILPVCFVIAGILSMFLKSTKLTINHD